MKRWQPLAALLFVLCVAPMAEAAEKRRVFVVSSYHKEYLWSQSTQKGLSEAMLAYGVV